MKKLFEITIFTAIVLIAIGCSKNSTSTNNGPVGSSISGNFSGNQSGSFVAVSDIDVPAGATLTLARGTIIKFQPGVKMHVHGKLVAVGDSAHLIQFTSAMSSPSPGDWGGIIFYPNTTDTSLFQYCFIGYGNRFDNAYEQDTSYHSNVTPGVVNKGMVSVNGAYVKLDRSILYKSGWEGVEVQNNGTALITHCDLYKTSNSALSVRINGNIIVSNSNITSSLDLGMVIHDEYLGGTFSGGYNNVWDNRSGDYRRKPSGLFLPLSNDISGDPAYTAGDNLDFSITPASYVIDKGDPTILDPDGTRSDIGVYYFRQSANILFGPLPDSLPFGTYHVVWNCYLNQGQTLYIAPGTTIKFDGFYAWEISGTLTAIGTASQPIIFTSNAATPAPGDWKNLFFNGISTNASRLSFCEFHYSGMQNPGSDYATGAISADGVNVNWDNLLIKDCLNDGIHLMNGCGGSVQRTTIDGFGEYGIRCILNITTVFQQVVICNGLGDGMQINSNSSPTLTNMLICNNGVSGIVMTQLCTPRISFVTVVNNTYDGITMHQNSLPTLRNSLIALNGRYGVDQYESSVTTHDHNLFWNATGDTTRLFVTVENMATHTVPLDSTEMIVDPQFQLTGTIDQRYRLQNSSPAKHAATDGTELGAYGGQGM